MNNYVVIGSNKILINNQISKIKSNIDLTKYEEYIFDLEEASIIELLEEINTDTFFNDGKILVLKNFVHLYEKKYADKNLIDNFYKSIARKSNNYILILLDSNTSVSIIKELKQSCEIIKIEDDKFNMNDFVIQSFKEEGFEIDKNAIIELVNKVNNDFLRVSQEIEKLKLYKYDNKRILKEDVDLLVSTDYGDNVFELLNFILDNNIDNALEMYYQLIIANIDQLLILSLLLTNLELLLEIKIFIKEKMDKQVILDTLGLSSGRYFHLSKRVATYSLKELKENINKLIKLEKDIKMGKVDKNLGFELYLLGIKKR
ncbi:MAG: DNA polymerase III subunit delta [Anaeroplasmataceae bacterium]